MCTVDYWYSTGNVNLQLEIDGVIKMPRSKSYTSDLQTIFWGTKEKHSQKVIIAFLKNRYDDWSPQKFVDF